MKIPITTRIEIYIETKTKSTIDERVTVRNIERLKVYEYMTAWTSSCISLSLSRPLLSFTFRQTKASSALKHLPFHTNRIVPPARSLARSFVPSSLNWFTSFDILSGNRLLQKAYSFHKHTPFSFPPKRVERPHFERQRDCGI